MRKLSANLERILKNQVLDIKIPRQDLEILCTKLTAIKLIMNEGIIADEGPTVGKKREERTREHIFEFQKIVHALLEQGYSREDILGDLLCKPEIFDKIMAVKPS